MAVFQLSRLTWIPLICISALCEEPVYVQSIYAPFMRGSAWKRYLGVWFYPGWPSGAVYTLSICVLFFTTMSWMRYTPLPESQFGGIAVAAGLCLPLVFANVLWPHLHKKWWLYVLVQAVLLIGSFALVQKAPRHTCSTLYGTDYTLSLLPISAFALAFESRRFCPVPGATALASIGIFLLLALPWWRVWQQVRHTENRSRAALEEQRQHG